MVSCSIASGLWSARLLCPWDGCPHPGNLPNPGIPGLLHCRQILYQLSYQGNPAGISGLQKRQPVFFFSFFLHVCDLLTWGFPGGSVGEVSACSAGDLGLISGSGRSPGEGNGNPLQYFCLENSMDERVW